MRAPCTGSLLIFLLITVLSTAGRAQQPAPQEDLPVNLKADFFRFDRQTRILTATGNVVLTTDEVVIRADSLVANLATGEVTAESNVHLTVGHHSLTADRLTYNLNTRTGVLFQAQADYMGPLVVGRVRLRAARMEGDPSRSIVIREGFATTCEPCEGKDPLIHLTAGEISIFIGDKIVGRRVTVWVAGRKVFTLPYFIIFLRERHPSRLTPVLGYSDSEGWFLKTSYPYFLSNSHYGFVHADWMERLGTGVGVEHLYQIGRGRGSALLYRLSNRQTAGTDLRGIVSHSHAIAAGVTARLYTDMSRQSFTTQPPATTLFSTVDLSRSAPGATSFLFSSYNHTSIGPASAWSTSLVHDQAFGRAMSGQSVLQFSRAQTPAGMDDELTPRFTLRHATPRFVATLVADTRLDIDGDRFPGDARYTLERLPELTFSFLPFGLGATRLSAQVDGGVAWFRETTIGPGSRTLAAARADLLTTITGPIPIGQQGVLGVRGFIRGTWYTPGQFRTLYGTRLEYTHALRNGFEARLGYTGQAVAGQSPFLFDQLLGTISAADAGLLFRNSRFFLSAAGAYDFQARQFGTIITRVFFVPRQQWIIAGAASYNANLGRLDRVETSLDIQLSKEWRVQYLGFYDAFSQRVLHDRVTLTRGFCDCVAISLTYLGLRNEFWVEAWLTAIPWARGRVGVGARGSLLFDQPFPFWQGR